MDNLIRYLRLNNLFDEMDEEFVDLTDFSDDELRILAADDPHTVATAIPRYLPDLAPYLLYNSRAYVRGAFIQHMAHLGVEEAAACAGVGLDDTDPHVRSLSVVALGILADNTYLPRLCEILLDHSIAWIQQMAAISLGEIGDPRAVDSLVQILTNQNAPGWVRKEVVSALGKLGGPAAREALIHALMRDTNGNIRADSAHALAHMKNGEPPISVLIHALHHHNIPATRREIARLLVLFNTPEVIAALIHTLHTEPRSDVIAEAIATLGKLKGETALQALIEFLAMDNPPNLQQSVIFALTKIPDGRALEAILHALRHHPHPDTRAAALVTFRRKKSDPDPVALAAILQALSHDEAAIVRGTAADTLKKWAHPAAVPALIARLADQGTWYDKSIKKTRSVASAAAEVLNAINTPEARAALVQWRSSSC